MPEPRKKGHGGRRKLGRNTLKCNRYRVEKRREKNKLKKLRRLKTSQPNNTQIQSAIDRLLSL